MTANKSTILLIAASIIAAIFLAGCTSPTPTPTPVPTAVPTVPPTISPVSTPTPVPGGDEAFISFTYTVREYETMYESIPVGPGEKLYAFDVSVSSDKPVSTDLSWFSIEYRQNSTSPLKTYLPMTVRDYPKTTIGNGSKPATGRVLIVLPAPGMGSDGPTPIYSKPVEQQIGPYFVKGPVRGVILR